MASRIDFPVNHFETAYSTLQGTLPFLETGNPRTVSSCTKEINKCLTILSKAEHQIHRDLLPDALVYTKRHADITKTAREAIDLAEKHISLAPVKNRLLAHCNKLSEDIYAVLPDHGELSDYLHSIEISCLIRSYYIRQLQKRFPLMAACYIQQLATEPREIKLQQYLKALQDRDYTAAIQELGQPDNHNSRTPRSIYRRLILMDVSRLPFEQVYWTQLPENLKNIIRLHFPAHLRESDLVAPLASAPIALSIPGSDPLPDDIFHACTFHLNAVDLANTARICRAWYCATSPLNLKARYWDEAKRDLQFYLDAVARKGVLYEEEKHFKMSRRLQQEEPTQRSYSPSETLGTLEHLTIEIIRDMLESNNDCLLYKYFPDQDETYVHLPLIKRLYQVPFALYQENKCDSLAKNYLSDDMSLSMNVPQVKKYLSSNQPERGYLMIKACIADKPHIRSTIFPFLLKNDQAEWLINEIKSQNIAPWNWDNFLSAFATLNDMQIMSLAPFLSHITCPFTRAKISLKIGIALIEADHIDDAIVLLKSSFQLGVPDPQRRTDLATWLADFLIERGRRAEAHALLAECASHEEQKSN